LTLVVRRLAALVVAGAVLAAGCSSDEPSADHVHAAWVLAAGQPDAAIAGPQGRVAQFVVECGFSHAAPDDPIVYPGEPGASHLHVFFGNTAVDADSTYQSLLGRETTCAQPLDTASYWAPALYRDGVLQEPLGSVAYYRPGVGVDPTSVQPYPPGLQMVAGDPTARAPQPTSVIAWTCGTSSQRAASPPSCNADARLRMLVTFPDCWDGVRLEAADHTGHVAYSTGGVCPAAQPVAIPQLQFTVNYGVVGDPAGLELASGSIWSGHADFLNSWDQAKLVTEVEGCLHRNVVCGVSGGGEI
jgi:hypothetical protein